MMLRGLGDRWLAGEAIDGIAHAMHAVVEIVGGRYDGQQGTVTLLMLPGDDPLYLVRLRSGDGDIRMRQSALREVRSA